MWKYKILILIILLAEIINSTTLYSQVNLPNEKKKCVTLAETGKLQESVDCFKSLIKKAPQDYNLYDSLGVTLAKLGDLKAAKESIEKAIQIVPIDPGPHRNLGYLYIEEKDYERAIVSFKNVIRYSYNDTETMDLVANLSMKIMDYRSAIRYWEEILKIDDAPILNINIAIAYEYLGDKENFRKYLAIGCKTEKIQKCEDLKK
ncbi:hypothetical protein CH371_20235 [Leptospira wolffii]|uniref:Uncharacterized protein n=1 Tax=Leptospira wolffii TaxID=409998 RepID=A0A2M9Z6J4_9LEPT|nr:hypothetical protein [Leptospira wolffii]PJZ64040.1 hypothetical protein CH371_20235 [Leptospira wolffii]